MEGPYEELAEAERRLTEYIKIMNSGFMPKHSTLALEPLELEKETARLPSSKSQADIQYR